MAKNRFYYFCELSGEFVEVKRTLRQTFGKSLWAVGAVGCLSALSLLRMGNPTADPATAQSVRVAAENRALRGQVGSMHARLTSLAAQMKGLSERDNQLRAVVDLPTLDSDTRQAGIGGVSEVADLLHANRPTGTAPLAGIDAAIDQLHREATIQAESYRQILSKHEANEVMFRHLPAIRPVDAAIVSGFGSRMHPILHIVRAHTGIDFALDRGSKVFSTGDGTVAFAGVHGGYGNCVLIDHGYGYQTLYGHLQSFAVRPGQKVERGQQIALSGNTGLSSGPHLHYEVVVRGVKQDPMNFFLDDISMHEYRQVQAEEAQAERTGGKPTVSMD